MFYETLIYAIILIFIVGLLFFMRPIKKVESVYKQSEINTRFEPTYYLIYDRSTPTECNRLIRVMPFNWVIWAINSNIYIIETTGAAICPSGTTPAIQVLSDIYSMHTTCLTVLFQSILNLYPGKPHKVFYDIEKSTVPHKFTILDALNDLFENYLTISFDDNTEIDDKLIFLNSVPKKQTKLAGTRAIKNVAQTNDMIKNRYEFLKPNYQQRLFKKIVEQSLQSETQIK